LPFAKAAKPSAPASWSASRSRNSENGRATDVLLRLAKPRLFMHLHSRGGPRGRRKRFRRSVAQWLEHRSPNSASAIPPNSAACHLVNVFGPFLRAQTGGHPPSYRPVLSSWVANWVAAAQPTRLRAPRQLSCRRAYQKRSPDRGRPTPSYEAGASSSSAARANISARSRRPIASGPRWWRSSGLTWMMTSGAGP
jgi:hypothetical protein